MDIQERFISYTKVDTTSNPEVETTPTTPNQFILAKQLVQELKDLGIEDAHVDEKCFVFGTLKSNVDKKLPKIALLAHVDTSDATSGANIKARVIENYDGKDIELSKGIWTKVEDYPELTKMTGKTIIVTDGTTLLGADDKAGIAIIMDYVAKCHEDPSIIHGDIIICFTPDEETGTGILSVNKKELDVEYAYTFDGGVCDCLTYECFNATHATVKFHGNSIHPGSAKAKMINACQLAIDFHNMLPVFDRPEFTEKYEGFNHMTDMQGDCQEACSNYIIRNHDLDLLHKQMHQFELAAEQLNYHYGKTVVELDMKETYHNMKECFVGKEYIIDHAAKAIADCGYEVTYDPIRGGTDGSHLSFEGIPTPNLGTGGMNFHGNHELVCVDDMKVMVKILTKIVEKIVEEGK